MIPFGNPVPVICAVMKDEAPYILEWVAWHRLQGFDIIVADNCTKGPQTRLLKALEAKGFIRYLDFRHVSSTPQLPAYSKMFWLALRCGYRYLGFLDADEFFEPLKGEPFAGARLVVDQLKKANVKAVGFRWCNFGSAGHRDFADDLVTERFQYRGRTDEPMNRFVKSFARLSAVLPHALRRPTRIMKSPHRFSISRRNYLVDGEYRLPGVEPHRATWRLARIRHYAIKSRAEFLAKRKRGDGFYKGEEKPGYATYWQDFDLNDTHDPLAPELSERLRAEIALIRDAISLFQ